MENLFNTGKLEESEYLVLSEWFNFLVSSPQMNFNVDQIIYVRTKPEVVCERIGRSQRRIPKTSGTNFEPRHEKLDHPISRRGFNTIQFPTNIKICTSRCARKADACFEMNKTD